MIDGALVRYVAVGLANTTLGYGVILLLQLGFELHPMFANAGGFAAGWVLSYVLNRRYTFRSTRSHIEGLPAYAASALLCYSINAAVLYGALNWVRMPALAAQALAMASYTVSFYLLSRYVVFKFPHQ